MADGQGRPRISADRSTFTALWDLWPYMWPAGRPDLKRLAVFALLALVAAKVVTVLRALHLQVGDRCTGRRREPAAVPAGALAGAAMMVLAYNAGRTVSNGLNQLRDGLFARVGQHAVRALAYRTFLHLHDLSLRFHLERRTGGLSRTIERGTTGIENIVRFTLLVAVPTLLEFALAAGVIWYQFDLRYLAVIAVTVWLYTWFTIRVTNWRITIRREMNESDTDAHSKAVDSLLNYETVKYFGNEMREAARFDRSMARYEAAAVRTWWSVAWLNFGQTVIFSGRHGGLHGAGGARGGGGNAYRRRFRADQRPPDAAFDPAQLPRHDVSRDQAGPCRHGGDVRAA